MGAFVFEWPAGEAQIFRDTIKVTDGILADFRPVWDKFIPNLRRRESVTFRRQADPFTRAPWPALEPRYAKRKRAMVGDKPILVFSGEMKRAASQKGAAGQHIVMMPTYMEFGVNVGIKAVVHQTTERTRKDGTAIKRRWLGMEQPTDGLALQAQVGRQIALAQKAAFPSRVTANVGRGTA